MNLADLIRMSGGAGRSYGQNRQGLSGSPGRSFQVVGQGPKNLLGEAFSAAFGANPNAVRASSWDDFFRMARGEPAPAGPPAYRPFYADPLPQHFGNDWSGMNNALLQRYPTLSGLLNYRAPQAQPLVAYGPAMGRRG